MGRRIARRAGLDGGGRADSLLERRIRRLRARSLKAWRRAEMDQLARALLQELNHTAAQARRAAKPPLVLVPVARAS